MSNTPYFTYCNSCFVLQKQIKCKFFITSCSHVFCETCMPNTKNMCRVCNSQCRVMEINDEMPAGVKMFFDDDSIRQLKQSIEKVQSFQGNQVQQYFQKEQSYRQQYSKDKQQLMKMNIEKKNYSVVTCNELEIMKRLKLAYR